MVGTSPQPLHVDIVAGLDPVLVRVRGELDLQTAPALRAILTPLRDRHSNST